MSHAETVSKRVRSHAADYMDVACLGKRGTAMARLAGESKPSGELGQRGMQELIGIIINILSLFIPNIVPWINP